MKPRYELEQDGRITYLVVRIPISLKPEKIRLSALVGLLKTAALTSRERQVTDMLLQGKSNKEIADGLAISVRTTKFHVSRVLEKTGHSSRFDFLRLGR